MMRKIRKSPKIIFAILLALLITTNATALDNATWMYYGMNNIYYYNPDGHSSGCLTGSNTNYSGSQVLSSAMTSAIQANQTFYQNSAEKYGFDWRIIAAIHVMENSAQRSNPANGQGAYQLYSYTNGGTNSNAFRPTGAISDTEFQRQTDIAAERIATVYGSGLNLSTPEGIKKLFFKYNGAAQEYVNKAIAMGFSEEDAKNGEGSPYVMNKYDSIRDPSSGNMDPNWPGMYVGDSKWDSNATSSRPGAFTIYVALGGTDGSTTNSCYIVGAGGGRLIAGESGMNLEEAQAFMQSYKDTVRGVSKSNLISLYGMTDNNCSGGVAYNCVSFTRYFINMYTNYFSNHITESLGNGADVVGNLLSGGYHFTNGGNTPRAYAIFSTSQGRTMCDNNTPCGHTGVILGIDTNTNTIIIGEALCGSGEAGIRARTDSLNNFMSSTYRYAYPNTLNFSN